MWTLLAGFKNALRYGLVGDHIDAQEALRIGLVNKVVPGDHLIRLPDVAARVVPGGNYHRVQVGPLASREEAERVRRQLAQSGIYSAHLIDGNGQRLEQ